jgi:hypothetical protein
MGEPHLTTLCYLPHLFGVDWREILIHSVKWEGLWAMWFFNLPFLRPEELGEAIKLSRWLMP